MANMHPYDHRDFRTTCCILTFRRAKYLGGLQLPGQAGHDVHRISAAHADGAHAQSAGVHRVRVCADHHAAREGVVLQHDLQAQNSSQTSGSWTFTGVSRPAKLMSAHISCSTSACVSIRRTAAYLVDDAGAWLPEADAVLGAGGGQEIVHLLVCLDGGRQVSDATKLSFPVVQ